MSQICASKKLDGDTTFRDQAVDVFMINADNIECIGVTVKECLHVGCYYHRAGSRIHAVTCLEHQDKQRLHFAAGIWPPKLFFDVNRNILGLFSLIGTSLQWLI